MTIYIVKTTETVDTYHIIDADSKATAENDVENLGGIPFIEKGTNFSAISMTEAQLYRNVPWVNGIYQSRRNSPEVYDGTNTILKQPLIVETPPGRNVAPTQKKLYAQAIIDNYAHTIIDQPDKVDKKAVRKQKIVDDLKDIDLELLTPTEQKYMALRQQGINYSALKCLSL